MHAGKLLIQLCDRLHLLSTHPGGAGMRKAFSIRLHLSPYYPSVGRKTAGGNPPATEDCTMERTNFIAVALAVAGWLGLNGLAMGAADTSDARGLAVGAQAPDFKLTDQNGNEYLLSGLQTRGKFVALVFYRSADW